MTMTMDQYQIAAQKTDEKPDNLIIPLLGLASETGTILAEYKKLLRDGEAHERFADLVAEDLGDILWYVANVATKCRIELSAIAEKNLEKTENRFVLPQSPIALPDEDCSAAEQLPRQFEYTFAYRDIEGVRKIVLLDANSGVQVGDPLTDNAYEDDGYRFHDVFHLAYASVLGWSPILRTILGKKRTSDARRKEVEDGGRAKVIEEGIAASVYEYAVHHNLLDGLKRIDWPLLTSIQRLTANLVEVRERTAAEWENAILVGFEVWRKVRQNDGGTVKGDLLRRSLEFITK
jgi:hypothetical protein